jgi:hypothetical protein
MEPKDIKPSKKKAFNSIKGSVDALINEFIFPVKSN